jgi:hypothetical protein
VRVSPPRTPKLERATLLRDVRERLAARFPDWAGDEPPATDPAWILLEQAAWMVEMLGEQLSEAPFAAIQQFVHLLGADLRPARPAVGVVMVLPNAPGALAVPRDRPSPWRFFTGQTETRDSVEFTSIEPSVPLRPARVASLTEISDGELRVVGRRAAETGLGAQIAGRMVSHRSAAFDAEAVEYTLVTTNAADTLRRVREAIAELDSRNLGWLAVSATETAEGRVVVRARVDATRAFARTAPAGLAAGADVEADWAPLEDMTWTPPVRIADVPGLPNSIRGERPRPGPSEGTLLVPGVPSHFPVTQLLQRTAAPLPSMVVKAIWSTLARIDTHLASFQVTEQRSTGAGAGAGEPTWPAAVLATDAWNRIATRDGLTIAHIQLEGAPSDAGVRIALMSPGRDRAPLPTVYGIAVGGGMLPAPLDARERWSFPVPGTEGLDTVSAFDVDIPSEVGSLLVVTGHPITGVLVNAVLVANAPIVPDRRDVVVSRAVPEAISLRQTDVVTPTVIADLLRQPLPVEVRSMLAALPLSHFQVANGAPIVDFAGTAADASLGEVTLNAPDHTGNARPFRSGDRITLDWYRATAGETGNVEQGAILYVEQPPRTAPNLLAVTNIAATHLGAARESEAACIARVFGPGDSVPVLSADWERRIRNALGARASAWTVRVWSYAERTLVSTRIWPLEELDAEAARLERALAGAGPDTLLVALGPGDSALTGNDLAWATTIIEAEITSVRERLSTVRKALVVPFWGLRAAGGSSELRLPAFALDEDGASLTDVLGRRAIAPGAVTLLNAAVLRVDGARRS